MRHITVKHTQSHTVRSVVAVGAQKSVHNVRRNIPTKPAGKRLPLLGRSEAGASNQTSAPFGARKIARFGSTQPRPAPTNACRRNHQGQNDSFIAQLQLQPAKLNRVKRFATTEAGALRLGHGEHSCVLGGSAIAHPPARARSGKPKIIRREPNSRPSNGRQSKEPTSKC